MQCFNVLNICVTQQATKPTFTNVQLKKIKNTNI